MVIIPPGIREHRKSVEHGTSTAIHVEVLLFQHQKVGFRTGGRLSTMPSSARLLITWS